MTDEPVSGGPITPRRDSSAFSGDGSRPAAQVDLFGQGINNRVSPTMDAS